MRILHLSDLHLREGWYEEQGVIIEAFRNDLETLLSDGSSPLLVFSGDFVHAGERSNDFKLFEEYFDGMLTDLGIGRPRRVFVPGNHDLSRQHVKLTTLRAVAQAEDDETQFNSNIYAEYADLICPKFDAYLDFESRLAGYGCGRSNFCGAGHDVGDDIGVYTLNTALFSFGGLDDQDGHPIQDHGLLRIESRRLHKWLQETKFAYRILVMHHPADHLVGWAKLELGNIIKQSFDLVLQGHVHMPDANYVDAGVSSTTICTAPPLFTRKGGMLGYALMDVDADTCSVELSYRQVSRSLRFVTGSFFTSTDDGKLRLGANVAAKHERPSGSAAPHSEDAILSMLRGQFETAATCHSSLGALWVEPGIGAVPETEGEIRPETVKSARELLSESHDLIIKAPPLFGLTALGHFLALEAWVRRPGSLYLLLMADEVPNHESGVRQAIQKKVERFGTSLSSLRGIILDNALPDDKLHVRKIGSIKKAFPHTHLVLLFKIDNQTRIGAPAESELEGHFDQWYVWSLSRGKIRDLVQQYCSRGCQLDEDALTQRIIDDLRVLNLYRTPINCITLMRIADAMFDHSPVNRTEMIERFLFLIFTDFARLPKYSTVPDVKDSTYALAHLCDILIRRNRMEFTKAEFFSLITNYCNEKVIDLDVDVLFGCLVNQNILVLRDNVFRFRFVHWILFFAAHRMYYNESFANFILKNRAYARFPEIIEFYSGIDRRRSQLLELLRDDLRDLNHEVEARIGISQEFNPYEWAKWRPSEKDVAELQREIDDEVMRSGLPMAVKDELADRNYDRTRPYRQELDEFIEGTSLYEAMRVMRAAATALRNSDHVDAELKRELLDEVMTTWLIILRLGIILTPLLVKDRVVDFEHVRFVLLYQPDEDPLKAMTALLHALPHSVVMNFEKDLGSRRMAPLFFDFVRRNDNRSGRLMMAICVLRFRPRGWVSLARQYIAGEDKNSFYLCEIYNQMRRELAVGFLSQEERAEMRELVGVAVARHARGAKKPGRKLVEEAARAVLGDD